MHYCVFKKSLRTGWLVFFLAANACMVRAGAPALIPLPQQMEARPGEFRLTPDTKIYASWGSLKTARQLAGELRAATGYPLKVRVALRAHSSIPNDIFLTTKSADPALGAEGYELTVASNSVVIRAPEQAGLFYGAQTLRQLLPPQIFSTNLAADAVWQAPCVEIKDWPRFKWRGLMLDVSRHFYNQAEVERLLDLMALHKLNRFHWHLVDDQGWRIEIKKYPLLTKVSAWRKQSVLFPDDPSANPHPAWMDPSADKFGPDGCYGGYYTQAEIREVVAYAAARHITIVPEIEMPGHSGGALAAYPQYGGGGRSRHGIYNPANEDTFKFLDGVLSEVFKLFPGQYVHIGGDEVNKRYWSNDPACQALMKREGLKNAEELQSWFVRRMEKYVNAHGKTLIGWSEILQGGLAQNAVVMDWIGGGQEAASAGHDVVMSPEGFCYLDHYQSKNTGIEPLAIGGFTPVKNIYLFDPMPANLPPALQSHVLGAQGNLWTEYVASLPHAEYMIFPRMCALSEVDWSAKDARNWDDFQSRLQVHEQRLDELGVNYRREHDGPMPGWPPLRAASPSQ